MNIGKSRDWDRLLDAIEESAAAETARAVIDGPMRVLEKRLGLGRATRTAMFGESELPHRSLILSWFEGMRRKAREERESGEFDGEGAIFEPPEPPGVSDPGMGSLSAGAWKVFPEDRMTPRERVERHIRFDSPDRVAAGPLLGFHTARAGGITVREFMMNGTSAARAARRAWDLYGGFDIMPFVFPTGYLFPIIPETHSRFCSEWNLPEGDELPHMIERESRLDYETLATEGFFAVARAEGGRLMREFRSMAGQMGAFTVEMARLFPRMDLFCQYGAGLINHPADLISMWIGFERFMMDCVTDPQKIREACERLGPGLVELGEFTGRLAGSRQITYGGSRMAASWISRKMFDNIFAGTFLAQARQAHRDGFLVTYHLDNDYTAFLDFFLEFPRHCGMLHLDQTDMFKAKEMLHGHICLMGNLHPGLLSAGMPDDVTNMCERLIKEAGAGGGFVLASACEVPLDTPVENLKAARDAVGRWGWY